MDTVLLRLQMDGATVEQLSLEATTDLDAALTQMQLDDSLSHLVGQEAVLIVPGMQVLALEKSLPKMPAAKLLKAIPYAIEDQLLDNIDQYHFIVSHINPNGNVALLAVLQKQMQQWLHPFLAHKIYCKAMLPEYLLLPHHPNSWTVVIEQYAIVRTGEYAGFCCDIDVLVDVLLLAWEQLEISMQPEKIIIYTYAANISMDPIAAAIPGIIIDIQSATQPLLSLMASQWQPMLEPANLLQGEFAQDQHLSQVKRWWLIAAGTLAAALVVAFINIIVQLIVLHHQDNKLKDQIAALYKQVYPQATTVVAPQIRMQRTLQDLQNNQAGGGYLGLLAIAGNVLHSLSSVQINTIRYQDNKLLMELRASNFSQLDQALKLLNQAGVIASQAEGSTKDNYVTAIFTIQEHN
jgi:general secretion pathway protein L